jgi:hypothetical protein
MRAYLSVEEARARLTASGYAARTRR